MTTPYSGKYAQIDFGASSYAEANHWTFDETSDTAQYGTFGGGGRKSAVAGQGSASGTVEGKYDFADPIEDLIHIGDAITLKLYLTTTQSGAAADRYILVPAIITDLNFDAEGDSGEPVSFTINFVSNGAWTDP